MIHAAALLGVLVISFSAVFVRLADVSPTTAAFFRMAYAVPVLFLLWIVRRQRDTRSRSERLLALAAGLVLSCDLSVWHLSIAWIGAGLSTVLANIQVLFVGGVSWLLFGEKPSRTALAVIPLILAGVALGSGLGRPGAYGLHPVGGALLGALTGLLYATFLVLFRTSNRRRVPPEGPLLDASLGAMLGCLAVGLLDPGFSFVPSWPAHGWLLALALLPQVLGWLLISIALPRLPALETSVMLLGQPVLTMFWGVVIFAEYLSGWQWGGVAAVLGGLAVLLVRGTAVGPEPDPERLREPERAPGLAPDQDPGQEPERNTD